MSKIKDLIPHQLTLEHRKQSSAIYARYKHPEIGKWREKSTGTNDIEEAEAFARRFHLELEFKVGNNIPTIQYSMNKLIDLYIDEMRIEHHHGRVSESNLHLKIRTANKFIREFFGDRMLHTIDAAVLREFGVWRRSYWKRKPQDALIKYERKWGTTYRPIADRERNSSVAMRDERAILNSLFRLAVQKRWISEYQVPHVTFKSPVLTKKPPNSKAKPFNTFRPEEYEIIKEKMLKWALRPAKFQYRRIAAYYYVMLAFNTGVRPGTGIDSLRWRDLKAINPDHPNDGEKIKAGRLVFVQSGSEDSFNDVIMDINVPTSKVGPHKSIGLGDAFKALQDYKIAWLEMSQTFQAKQTKVNQADRVELLQSWNDGDPLFLLPNGYQLNGSQASAFFTKFLEDTDMRCAVGEDEPRSLYSARHAFITHLQSIGVPDGLICEFTGTSQEMMRKHYSHPDPVKVGLMFANYS